jgi:Zn-dependent M28 family amino/carboxypeptidase
MLWGVLKVSLMLNMPGESHQGPLPPLTDDEVHLRDELTAAVRMLAGQIGERHMDKPKALEQAASYLETQLRAAAEPSSATVRRLEFVADRQTIANIEMALRGTRLPDEIVVVGAHYDSVENCPAANDNGSGVAALLALARRLRPAARTIKFVAFTNEEYFQARDFMGSYQYAREARRRGENIVAMFSLETIGYYSDAPGSQHYPEPLSRFYPTTGNFIGFVGNLESQSLVRRAIRIFRDTTPFPSEGVAAPGAIPGIGWSDHWSFWEAGYPGVMITDTAPFRYQHYHTWQDTPDKLNYEHMARVTAGIQRVIAALANE